jgi:hypothetical protein
LLWRRCSARETGKTPNAQRPTPNVQVQAVR